MLRRTYELDMVPGGIPLSIHLSQYDSDVTLIFELYASQGTLSIPSTGVTAQIIRNIVLRGRFLPHTEHICHNRKNLSLIVFFLFAFQKNTPFALIYMSRFIFCNSLLFITN